MTYQIGNYTTENKEEATLRLVEMLKDNEETFQSFLQNKFEDTDTIELLNILLTGDEETTTRFQNMFTTYCFSIAQDILEEGDLEGCFIM